jgi:Fe-S cluster biogenesis protein NfuA/nitrite reductase/ring-hydroxylating ferredoxin subunit
VEDAEAREHVERVEALLDEVESLEDPSARDKATELVQALLDLYGEGLARVMARASEADGGRLAAELAGDELVAHLLLLHDLHPLSLERRVREALDEVRPYLESHGGDVELLGVEEPVVRLRLRGSCEGCPSSAMTLKLAIEDALFKAAPEIESVEAEGASESPPKLVQLEVSDALREQNGAPPSGDGVWAMAGALPDVAEGATALKTVSGEPVLFARLGNAPYAYRPTCPACHGSLEGATLAASELSCPGCGGRYDARRAGRGIDARELSLEPVPLLVDEAGLVKVAVGSPAGA